jgi:cell division protein FtsB
MATTEPSAKSSLLRAPLWALLIAALLLGLALFGDRGLLRALQASDQQSQLEEQVKQLEAANAVLRREIEALRSDRRTLENIARKELGMVKDDELVYQFRGHPAVVPRPAPAPASPASGPTPPPAAD